MSWILVCTRSIRPGEGRHRHRDHEGRGVNRARRTGREERRGDQREGEGKGSAFQHRQSPEGQSLVQFR